MKNNFDSINIIKTIFKWKWHIIIITVIAAILGVVFSSSFFIKPKFKSTAVLYPHNMSMISTESKTEQMLQIINSDDIKFMVIDENSLDIHYEVDRNSQNYLRDIFSEYDGKVSIKKTPNDAVQITVLDIDPNMACRIVESIINNYNNFSWKSFTGIQTNLLDIYTKAYEENELEMKKLAEDLTMMRVNYNLLDLKSQIKFSTNKNLLENWEKRGAEYQKIDSLYNSYIHMQSENLQNIKSIKREIITKRNFCRVISNPFPASTKSTPVRWLIVLLSILGAFFTSSIVAVFFDIFKENNI
ncbi:MAG: hypothetical protein LBV69_11765 [Bacteroidales bacterium]|jgi:capsular polysaccharide biosynthesis protein|nr:hypothetical protein [Bacteroidales bacterium]